MIRAWLRALFGRSIPPPSPSPPADAWSEEAFYGMADQLYGHDAG